MKNPVYKIFNNNKKKFVFLFMPTLITTACNYIERAFTKKFTTEITN